MFWAASDFLKRGKKKTAIAGGGRRELALAQSTINDNDKTGLVNAPWSLVMYCGELRKGGIVHLSTLMLPVHLKVRPCTHPFLYLMEADPVLNKQLCCY